MPYVDFLFFRVNFLEKYPLTKFKAHKKFVVVDPYQCEIRIYWIYNTFSVFICVSSVFLKLYITILILFVLVKKQWKTYVPTRN